MAKTIHTFDILHEGWATDNKGWIAEDFDGIRRALTTTHGLECPMTVAALAEKIAETERSLIGLKRAKELIAK